MNIVPIGHTVVEEVIDMAAADQDAVIRSSTQVIENGIGTGVCDRILPPNVGKGRPGNGGVTAMGM